MFAEMLYGVDMVLSQAEVFSKGYAGGIQIYIYSTYAIIPCCC